jgi:hypothetical protein
MVLVILGLCLAVLLIRPLQPLIGAAVLAAVFVHFVK